MTYKLAIGGILGGIILFIWSATSWMVLPFHNMTLNKFSNPSSVVQTIQTNAPQTGIYLSHAEKQSNVKGPMVFVATDLKGMPTSMVPAMIKALIAQMLAALLVTWMLMKTKALNYFQRLGFVLVFALTAGIAVDFPYWNWFHFETNFMLVQIADLLIGWFLAGLLLAKITRPR